MTDTSADIPVVGIVKSTQHIEPGVLEIELETGNGVQAIRVKTPANPKGYLIVEEPLRIDALDDLGVAICGAYQPLGHDYWVFFVTQTVTRITGLTVLPHREHFYGELGRVAVRQWVELLACLAAMAMKGQQ